MRLRWEALEGPDPFAVAVHFSVILGDKGRSPV